LNRAARKLFPSDEDALQFLEDHGLIEAHAGVLKELGRVLEPVVVHIKEGDS